MTLHMFQSGRTPGVFGFTVSNTGENLPVELGPWEKAGSAIPLNATVETMAPDIGEQIRQDGYALLQTSKISSSA